MDKVKECVLLVEPMFICVRDQNFEELQRIAEQVFRVEHEADLVKVKIREAMPKAFSLPVLRGDLLAYLKLQDDMADAVEDIAVVLTLKRLAMPKGLADEVIHYVQQVLQVCDFLFNCTDQLADLTEADFAGDKGQEILELVAKAERAEWEADKLEYSVAQRLFALEDELKPADLFLWSGVFRELGRLANHADKTAERLRRMIVR
jgi:predicted phosphate transport protein (TIGR00153 family)